MSVEKGRKVYVLVSNCQILGVWTNLKYLCRDRQILGFFPSYSKLSKEIALIRNNAVETPVLDVTTKDNAKYQIKVEVVKG
jgi:hypothetical protein